MTYVMADIHGHLQRFQDMLKLIQFCSDDQLYILGDVIDRHPHGMEILRTVMDMPNVHMILGNHEYMMLDALGFPYENADTLWGVSQQELLDEWYGNGGQVTHEGWKSLDKDDQARTIDYLKSLPININIEIGDRMFKLVHGTATEVYDACLDFLDVSKAFYCVWDRDSVLELADIEQYTTIFGHSATEHFQDSNPQSIFYFDNVIGIDCGCGYPDIHIPQHSKGRFGCLRLEDMQAFYVA